MFVCELSGSGFESSCSHLNFRFRACFEQGVPWYSGNYRVWVHCETRTWHDKNIQANAPYRQVLTTQLSYLKRPFRLNGWVFVYELSGCGFESSYSHLNFKFRACFEQGVPWYSGNYRVWVHSEMSTWHDIRTWHKNIQSDSTVCSGLGWNIFKV